jgi:Tol biopolymer transport system component
MATKAHLVPKEPTGGIFIRDRQFGTTVRVPVAFNRKPLFDQLDPSISDDGRFVTFTARESRLGVQHIFVWDSHLRIMERADVSTAGVVADRDSDDSEISPDGRFVVFISDAENLASNDTVTWGVYIRDRKLHTTRRVSFAGQWYLLSPHVNAGGWFIIFISLEDGASCLFLHDQAT